MGKIAANGFAYSPLDVISFYKFYFFGGQFSGASGIRTSPGKSMSFRMNYI